MGMNHPTNFNKLQRTSQRCFLGPPGSTTTSRHLMSSRYDWRFWRCQPKNPPPAMASGRRIFLYGSSVGNPPFIKTKSFCQFFLTGRKRSDIFILWDLIPPHLIFPADPETNLHYKPLLLGGEPHPRCTQMEGTLRHVLAFLSVLVLEIHQRVGCCH